MSEIEKPRKRSAAGRKRGTASYRAQRGRNVPEGSCRSVAAVDIAPPLYRALRNVCTQLLVDALRKLRTTDVAQLAELVQRSGNSEEFEPTVSAAEGELPKAGAPSGTVQQIIDAPKTTDEIVRSALAVFLEEGYGVSIDRIASRAGVSKRTVYSHFPSKRLLFSAATHVLRSELTPTFIESSGEDLLSELLQYAQKFRSIALSDHGIRGYRLLTVPLKEYPQLGELGAEVLDELLGSLAAYFRKFIAAGKLIDVNPEFLAEQYFSIIIGQSRSRALWGVYKASEPRERAYVRQAVQTFVRGILVDVSRGSCGAERDRRHPATRTGIRR